MLRGQKVSRLLVTSFKILVANTQFLVALATSQSQFRTLDCPKARYVTLHGRVIYTSDSIICLLNNLTLHLHLACLRATHSRGVS